MSAIPKEWKTGTQDNYVVRTCAWSPPGDHPVGCGVKLTVKDGKIVGVEGDKDNPISQGRLCVRCLAIADYEHAPQRVTSPMKRAREDRGLDKWEKISWDEAYDIIVENLNEVKEKYGPETCCVFSGTGREAFLYAYPLAFGVLGCPNSCFAMSGYSCYGPRCAIAGLILGSGYPELDYAAYFPDRYDHEGYVLPEYIILWGKDPLFSNPDGFYGHSLIDLMKRGTKIITIDPMVTWMSTRAYLHLQLRPGTDTALGMAMINTIIEEDLYDHDFVENWTFGLDELRERVKEMPASKAAEITWVPEEKIVAAARAFGSSRHSSIMWGLAMDEQTNGTQAGHCAIIMMALAGVIDHPGGITLGPPSTLVGAWSSGMRKNLSSELWAKRIGTQEYPGYAATNEHPQPDLVLDALETGKPYMIHFAWYQSSNLLAPTCSAQPQRWHAALKKVDFAVVTDLVMTPTAMALADVFLPLSAYPEHDGIVITHFGRNTHLIGAMNEALHPYDTKSDLEICLELGKRTYPELWPWNTAAEFFDSILVPEMGMTFDELREIGYLQNDYEYYKYESGKLRDDGYQGFNTPTGMIEFYSTLFEQFGEDPLPYYMEPNYSPFSTPELAEEYPLIFTSGHRKTTSFHSEHRHIKVLRDIDPDPIITIHPKTAEKYGIGEGDWVEVYNMFGQARLRAKISDTLHEQVVHCTHGWWYPEQEGEEPNLFGNWKSNVNTLVPHKNIGKLGYGAPFKSCICNIKKVDGLEG